MTHRVIAPIVDLPDVSLSSWVYRLGPDVPGRAAPGLVIDRRELHEMYDAGLFRAVAVRVHFGERGELGHPPHPLRGGVVVGVARAVCLSDRGDVLGTVDFSATGEGPDAARLVASMHLQRLADTSKRGPALSLVPTTHVREDGRIEAHAVHFFDVVDRPAMDCQIFPMQAPR